jgi:hypothetical protein
MIFPRGWDFNRRIFFVQYMPFIMILITSIHMAYMFKYQREMKIDIVLCCTLNAILNIVHKAHNEEGFESYTIHI